MLLTFCGCFSSGRRANPAKYYVLREEVISATDAHNDVKFPNFIIAFDRVRVPEYVRRQQIVTRDDDGQLRIHDGFRWGEPLDIGLTAVLRELLMQQMPGCLAVSAPWSSDILPNLIIHISFEELSIYKKSVYISAHYSVEDAAEKISIWNKTFSGSFHIGKTSVESMLSAMRQLLNQLAKNIAIELIEMQENFAKCRDKVDDSCLMNCVCCSPKINDHEHIEQIENLNQISQSHDVVLEADESVYVIVDNIKTGTRIISKRLEPQQRVVLPHDVSSLRIMSSAPKALSINGLKMTERAR
jgi:uncharacterized lipoprotein YmbA